MQKANEENMQNFLIKFLDFLSSTVEEVYYLNGGLRQV